MIEPREHEVYCKRDASLSPQGFFSNTRPVGLGTSQGLLYQIPTQEDTFNFSGERVSDFPHVALETIRIVCRSSIIPHSMVVFAIIGTSVLLVFNASGVNKCPVTMRSTETFAIPQLSMHP